MTEPSVFKRAAVKLGWRYEPAYGGWINEANRRQPPAGGSDFDTYEVADTPEEACYFSGYEDEAEAAAYLRDHS